MLTQGRFLLRHGLHCCKPSRIESDDNCILSNALRCHTERQEAASGSISYLRWQWWMKSTLRYEGSVRSRHCDDPLTYEKELGDAEEVALRQIILRPAPWKRFEFVMLQDYTLRFYSRLPVRQTEDLNAFSIPSALSLYTASSSNPIKECHYQNIIGLVTSLKTQYATDSFPPKWTLSVDSEAASANLHIWFTYRISGARVRVKTTTTQSKTIRGFAESVRRFTAGFQLSHVSHSSLSREIRTSAFIFKASRRTKPVHQTQVTLH
ncbi:hypothetical protein BXZ70DRAFT_909634 [Cristinia sonorae]|uniref:Uncharacterized protein n=1 Tax=Cristinia sonorae TaxID=1940300 RepID=A0A8K0UH26_9AGAR|nr:hypothetical protein BXZ70DRAFT_909634 [Cristinia sonorae]